jgi:hypothetical protein
VKEGSFTMKLSPSRSITTLWRGSALLKASAGAPESDDLFIGTACSREFVVLL